MEMKNPKTFKADDGEDDERDLVGQGQLYAPPSSATAASSAQADGNRTHLEYEHPVADDDAHNAASVSATREEKLKLMIEKAMEKVKGSLPAESLDKAANLILGAFRDAQSSTKDAVQRVKDLVSSMLPISHQSEMETIVDDVERQMLSKSEAPGIASKL